MVNIENKDKELLDLAESITDYSEWSYVESLSHNCVSEEIKNKIKRKALHLYLKEEASVNKI